MKVKCNSSGEEGGGRSHHVWVWMVWNREDVSRVHCHNSSFQLKVHYMKIEIKWVLTICIMGGGIAQCIRTALPLCLCLHQNQLHSQGMGVCVGNQVKLIESTIFSSCLRKVNLASSSGLVKISCKLVLGWNIARLNFSTVDVITNKMMTNLNMLRPWMLHRVVTNLDCTLIVTQKRHFVTMDTIFL